MIKRFLAVTNRSGRFWMPLLLCLAVQYPVTRCAAQEPEVIVEVDRQQLYEGESLIYRVTLNHVDNPSPPTLNGFDAFTVEFVGEQSLDSHQLTIINGRRSEVIRRGHQYNYRLTPKQSGSLTIPAPFLKCVLVLPRCFFWL